MVGAGFNGGRKMTERMTLSEIADWLDIESEWAKAASAYDDADRYTQAAATIRELEAMGNRTACELDQVSAAIGTVRFMDPPDGGSVTLAEQVARMHDALNAAEAKLKIATEALGRIKEADAEININNYTEEDVIDLNDAFVDMWREADQALARINEVG